MIIIFKIKRKLDTREESKLQKVVSCCNALKD